VAWLRGVVAFLIGAARFASSNVHWIQVLHPENKPAVAWQPWCRQIVTERTGVDVFVNDQYAIVWVARFASRCSPAAGSRSGRPRLPPTILQRQ
jgi:hypothetical protein